MIKAIIFDLDGTLVQTNKRMPVPYCNGLRSPSMVGISSDTVG